MSGPRRYFVLVGNSGVGKSYLLNALQPSKVFEAREDFGSVTTEVEQAEYEGVTYLNIPGLLEADPTNIARNKRELERAMLRRNGEYRMGFVFGLGNGGRVDAKDITAYKEFCRGYAQSPEQLPVILNNAPPAMAGKLEQAQAYLRPLGITAPTAVVAHDAPPEAIAATVRSVTEKLPWRGVSKVAEMNLDAMSEEVRKATVELQHARAAVERAQKESAALRQEVQQLQGQQSSHQQTIRSLQYQQQSAADQHRREMDNYESKISRLERELGDARREAAAASSRPMLMPGHAVHVMGFGGPMGMMGGPFGGRVVMGGPFGPF